MCDEVGWCVDDEVGMMCDEVGMMCDEVGWCGDDEVWMMRGDGV